MINQKPKPENQSRTDLRDSRGGAYEPANELGMPQPDPPYDAPSLASVPHPMRGDQPPLPEGLRRPRIGPDHKPRES